MALAAIVTAMVLRSTDSILLSVLGGLAIGVFFGFITDCLWRRWVYLPSITLGMSSIILGIARWVSGLQSIPLSTTVLPSF